MYFLGIDIGSLTCDAVIIDGSGKQVAWSVIPTGARNIESIERARREFALGKGEATLVTECLDARLVVLDDIGQEASRGDTAIWDVVDGRYTKCRPTIVTSGLSPVELSDRYGAAFVRRLNQDGRAVVGNAFGKGKNQ